MLYKDVFLGRRELIRLLREGILSIEPLDESQIGAFTVDLTLHNVFRIFEEDSIEIHDDNFDISSYGRVLELKEGEPIMLKPGQMVLGVTREVITLPENIGGILAGRSRYARAGLMVHVSSNFIHPGSSNRQVLEIINLGPFEVKLYPGVRICQAAFFEIKGGEKEKGRYSSQLLP